MTTCGPPEWFLINNVSSLGRKYKVKLHKTEGTQLFPLRQKLTVYDIIYLTLDLSVNGRCGQQRQQQQHAGKLDGIES